MTYKSEQIEIKKNSFTKPRLRFAPSPTGGLHTGTARTALFNWIAAKSMGGKLILRIEDTDQKRSLKKYEDSIINDLIWLGISWDEFYRQSERLKIYSEYSRRLLDEGRAYRCFCTPERLEALKKSQHESGADLKYDNRCANLTEEEIDRKISAGEKSAVRFKVVDCSIKFDDMVRGGIIFNSGVFGDFVIIKSDGTPTYNFAVVIDDIDMEISHVLRGEDHITNTARQILIFDSLSHEKPQFGHFSMILGKDGAKLSKRHGAKTINEFKNDGYLAGAMANYLALLSWSPKDAGEIFEINETLKGFDIKDISKSPAIFDPDKLKWINSQHIRKKTNEQLKELLVPFIKKDRIIPGEAISDKKTAVKLNRCIDAFKDKIKVLADFSLYIKDYFSEKAIAINNEAAGFLNGPASKDIILRLYSGLKRIDIKKYAKDGTEVYEYFDENFFKSFLAEISEEFAKINIKGRALFMPIRIALTGSEHGPEIPKAMSILGIETCCKRIENIISGFNKKQKIDKIG